VKKRRAKTRPEVKNHVPQNNFKLDPLKFCIGANWEVGGKRGRGHCWGGGESLSSCLRREGEDSGSMGGDQLCDRVPVVCKERENEAVAVYWRRGCCFLRVCVREKRGEKLNRIRTKNYVQPA